MKVLLCAVVMLCYGSALSQTDDCVSPTNLLVNNTCLNTSFANNANGTGQIVNASCASGYGTAYEDAWYLVTGTGNPITITLSGANEDAVLAVFSSCGLGEITCTTINSGMSGSVNFTTTVGTNYYIQIQRRSGTGTGNQSGQICAVSTMPSGSFDDPCGAAPLSVSTSCSYSTFSNAGATPSTGVPAPGCASYSGGDVWFSITVPAGGAFTVDLNHGNMTDSGLALYSGTCGALNLIACDDDGSSNVNMSSLSVTGQMPGTTIYARVWEFGNNNNGTFGICVTMPPVPPSNDECATAIPLTVNPDFNCGSITAGTVENATPSPQNTTACIGAENDDVWFTFTATHTSHSIDLINVTGSTMDLYHSVWYGSCPSLTLVSGSCSDPNSSMVTGLTIGQTYYIRVHSYFNSSETSTFNVCVGTPPPTPTNDNCNGAIAATMSNTTCSLTSGSIASATASSQPNTCYGTANDDVWFSFVATAASANISLENVTGSTIDLYHSVYAGTCASIGSPLICSDPNSSTVTGLIVGNTYYVRVYSWGSTSATTSFDLCILSAGPCGTPDNQDYCMNPATLTEGPGDFSANTSSSYSSDTPGNLNGVFCGSVENNSWYSFIATSTTHTFNFASVSNCQTNWGVQAQVYSVAQDVNGCCTNFSSMSNCYNPGTNSPGTVTATGLTIGNEYILMVDGNAGDQCDFTVIGWTAVGIIPLSVDLVNFKGLTMPTSNELSWSTRSETNNDYFTIERSLDGISFEAIGRVEGAGNSTTTLNYNFSDNYIRTGTVYYRLKQVDLDGSSVKSEIIPLTREMDAFGLISIYPNPAKDRLTIETNIHQAGTSIIRIVSIEGTVLYQSDYLPKGFELQTIDINFLRSGMYYVQLIDNISSRNIKPFIKE